MVQVNQNWGSSKTLYIKNIDHLNIFPNKMNVYGKMQSLKNNEL